MYQLNITIILISLLTMGLTVTELHSSESSSPFSHVEKNGMHLRWKIDGKDLICELSAPTTGWIAMGFNTRSGLSKTNLIMGRVEQGKPYMEDHYIVRPGLHKQIADMGGQTLLHTISGSEQTGKTHIQFKIPLRPSDDYHYTLSKGQSYYVLLAYSQEDDFDHHSSMRTEVEITL